MQPNSEPTPQDIAMVSQSMGATPPPTPQPQMQPSQPTPQPAPTQQPATPPAQPTQPSDPFANFGAPTEPTAPTPPPTQPTEPVPTPQPSQPTEPPQPTPTPPTEQPTPQPQAQVPAEDDYQTFDEYMASTLQGVPNSSDMPDPEKINPEDPAAIKQFFDDLVNTAVTKAEAKVLRQNAIQNTERRLWDTAFEKYPSLRTNKEARDLVHSVRMGYFQRGYAITPIQAAQKLLATTNQSYQQGVVDNQVHTTIESVQPNGTGSNAAPVPTTLDKDSVLTAVQTGGETALAEILDREIKAGRL